MQRPAQEPAGLASGRDAAEVETPFGWSAPPVARWTPPRLPGLSNLVTLLTPRREV